VLTTHVGPGETQLVAEKVAQEKARLGQPVVAGAVDDETDPNGCWQEDPRTFRPNIPCLGD
jgi:hypothetical protein